ncbi:MAG: GAF domain-containing protein [Bacteroidales bacterium]|nr:GAF domain-containing protein [Bacteroidales bacterium]
MLEDSLGHLYIGTKGGLHKQDIQTGKIIIYTTKNGLPSDDVSGMQKDDEGNIWISTSNGLSKFSPKDSVFTNYDVRDGLMTQTFDLYLNKTDNMGNIIFGGRTGLAFFNPRDIKNSEYLPRVYLTDFKLFNQSVPVGRQSILKKHISMAEQITLTHKQTVFSFHFTALNYTLPEKNQFAYKLENFDVAWVNIGNKREVSYTNLNAGDYVFRVRASNNDGIWNKQGTSIKLKILPPFWKTWWFRISLFVFIVSASIAFYRYRVNALKRQKEKLEKEVAARTADLMEANTELEERQQEIEMQAEEISAQRDTLVEQKDMLEIKNTEVSAAYNKIKVLSSFGQKITSTLNIESINNMIYEYVASLMDTSAFGIGLYNEEKQVIEFARFMEEGKTTPFFVKALTQENSLSVRCFKNKEEIVIRHLSEEYKKYSNKLPDYQTSNMPESMIHLPLIIENRVIGTLTVNSFKVDAYSENDINNLRSLASYISIALDNANVYKIINDQNHHIKSSIDYAQNIQKAILPPKEIMDKYFDSFILFRPKDIVSGDFYWFAPINESTCLLAAIDCTGHGVQVPL